MRHSLGCCPSGDGLRADRGLLSPFAVLLGFYPRSAFCGRSLKALPMSKQWALLPLKHPAFAFLTPPFPSPPPRRWRTCILLLNLEKSSEGFLPCRWHWEGQSSEALEAIIAPSFVIPPPVQEKAISGDVSIKKLQGWSGCLC